MFGGVFAGMLVVIAWALFGGAIFLQRGVRALRQGAARVKGVSFVLIGILLAVPAAVFLVRFMWAGLHVARAS